MNRLKMYGVLFLMALLAACSNNPCNNIRGYEIVEDNDTVVWTNHNDVTVLRAELTEFSYTCTNEISDEFIEVDFAISLDISTPLGRSVAGRTERRAYLYMAFVTDNGRIVIDEDLFFRVDPQRTSFTGTETTVIPNHLMSDRRKIVVALTHR